MTATAEPNTIEFDMSPQTYPEKSKPWLPPSLRGSRFFTFEGGPSPKDAQNYGLYKMKFKKGCVGLKPEQFFYPGDVAEVPGNWAWQYASLEQAEFVRTPEIEKECELLDRAKKAGYVLKETHPKRLADRPEFKSVIDASRKGTRWMDNLIQRTPASS